MNKQIAELERQRQEQHLAIDADFDKRIEFARSLCSHTITQGRECERGLWCVDCGIKVYDVENRQCKDCAHSITFTIGGMGCNRHLMAVSPDMNATFKISEGSCWTAGAPMGE